MEHIETGLLLMVVGMTTVFIILLLLVYLGKSLIILVNKYFPEEATPGEKPRVQAAIPATGTIPGEATAAIVSAISVLTNGKGKITKIEKQ